MATHLDMAIQDVIGRTQRTVPTRRNCKSAQVLLTLIGWGSISCTLAQEIAEAIRDDLEAYLQHWAQRATIDKIAGGTFGIG